MQESDRLYFKKLDETYLEALHKLHSNPEVMKYVREPDDSIERTKQTIRIQLENYVKFPGLGLYCAHQKTDDAFIGWGYIYHLEFNPELPIEVGYRLSPDYWGQGYGTEIAKNLVQYGFESMQATKLCAVANKVHKASHQILYKCGFEFIREDHYYDHSCLYFECLAQK